MDWRARYPHVSLALETESCAGQNTLSKNKG
uniref:Uncharacterized protein n=1 Tax=Anguilla anguilla TaxID=7936 RepID=A0A0E9Q3T6_ANGAN